jgi:predicted nuclease with TOPRIM domain
MNQINAIQTRNKVKTFLFGTDYKSANELRKEMTATENQIDELNQLKEQIQNENHKVILEDQVQLLEQEKIKLQSFVEDNEDKFSLFGWFVKIFVK